MRTTLIATLLAAIFLLTANLSIAETSADNPAIFESDDKSEVRVDYATLGSFVTAKATTLESNNIKLEIQVDNVLVTAVFDKKSQSITINGYDNAIFKEQKIILGELAQHLEENWDTNAPDLISRNPNQHFLYSLVNLLAEAPAGMTLESMTIPLATGVKKIGRRAPSDLAAPASLFNRALLEGGPSIDTEVNLLTTEPETATCEVSGGDGVIYYPCGFYPDITFHDASPYHCYGYRWDALGCNQATNCRARCGPGCGGGGAGKYTWDCGDHDVCCGIHGNCLAPILTVCADEWREAINDFFASSNCTNC